MAEKLLTAPAFQFYAQDFLTGVMYLTNEEIGIYIKMLAKQWTDGKIPKKRLGFLVGSEWVSLSEELRSKFEDCGEYIVNRRLEKEREKKANFHQKQSENGKKGGRPPKDNPIESSDNNGFNDFANKNPKQKKINPTLLSGLNQTKAKKSLLEEEDEIEDEEENEIKKEIEVLNFLNETATKNFQPVESNLKFIRARLAEHPPEVLKQIIQIKTFEWKDDFKMNDYLRPETLFNSTKFQTYLQKVEEIKQNPQKFKLHVEQRNTELRKSAAKHYDPLDAMPD